MLKMVWQLGKRLGFALVLFSQYFFSSTIWFVICGDKKKKKRIWRDGNFVINFLELFVILFYNSLNHLYNTTYEVWKILS